MASVIGAKPTIAMHHIQKISDRPDLRMDRSNWLAVCQDHHDELENDIARATEIKRWAERHYAQALSITPPPGGG